MTFTTEAVGKYMYGRCYGIEYRLLADGDVIGVIYSEDDAQMIADALNRCYGQEQEQEAVTDEQG